MFENGCSGGESALETKGLPIVKQHKKQQVTFLGIIMSLC